MAKAVKAPIRTKTEAFRDASDAVEGRAVRDEAWFNAQNPIAVTCHCESILFHTPKLLSHSLVHFHIAHSSSIYSENGPPLLA